MSVKNKPWLTQLFSFLVSLPYFRNCFTTTANDGNSEARIAGGV